jgi:hypothetical protein
MNFSERIHAVLHGETPDRVPFVPYAHLIPRGEFAREMRDRGMGLLVGCSAVWQTQPHMRVETRIEGDVRTTLYHTPAGTVSASQKTHVGRIADGGTIRVDRMIRGVEDYDPVIYMVEDTEFHLDSASYDNTVRDLGADGIVRSSGVTPPYLSSMGYFRLEDWSYTQYDHPDRFARLISALERQQERRFPFVLDSPVELLSCGATHDGYGPEPYRAHALPFYEQYIPRLKAANKICSIHAHNSQLRLYAHLLFPQPVMTNVRGAAAVLQHYYGYYRRAIRDALNRSSRKPFQCGGLRGYDQLVGIDLHLQERRMQHGPDAYLDQLHERVQNALRSAASQADQVR